MRVAYADPPYPGCAHRYPENTEVDHSALARRLATFDGFALHTASTTLYEVEGHLRRAGIEDYRVAAWVKPFAAFKRNVSVAYAWEPVLIRACRKPVVTGREVMRDWVAEPITLQRGVVGAKPARVCRWVFELLGLAPEDELLDLYPGTGAVLEAWDAWRRQTRLAV